MFIMILIYYISTISPGACYKIFSQDEDYTSYDNARSKCKTVGADLASIHSIEENEFVLG